MAIQDKGNTMDGWKQSLGQGKVTDNLIQCTPHLMASSYTQVQQPVSTARSYKDNKYHGVTDQYSRPSPGTHHHQADYIPSTYTPARAYTLRGKKHHVVLDQYSRPYPGNYGNQIAYFPSTYMSTRTYCTEGRNL
ncbi:hypothetical protein ACJMK2_007061 [Sinanodonta woodiana]|uniref:Uncharacterized protein n=1 Tax=Sinanodonta woodiana TaxID=1069815 RepID=A0ABD3VHF6_SINWO